MADGYSTASSLGGGLGACRRAAGAFDLYTAPGTGTVVIARVGAGSRLDQPLAARAGGIMSARPGEQESGDGWCAWWGAAGLTVTIVDGLGHGPEAAEARNAGLRSVAGEVSAEPGRAPGRDEPPAVRRARSGGGGGSPGPRQARLLRRGQHRRPARQRRTPARPGVEHGHAGPGPADPAARHDAALGRQAARSSPTPTASGPAGISPAIPARPLTIPRSWPRSSGGMRSPAPTTPPSSWLSLRPWRRSMSDDPVLSRPAFPADGAAHPGQLPDGTSAPGEWILSRWRVQRPEAARTCTELALTLTRLGAAADDRAHAVAVLWAALRLRLPALVTFRLTNSGDHRTGVLAVDDEILTTMQLPATSAATSAAPSAGPAAAAALDGEAPALAATAVPLLDIIADQDTALDHHRRELESTDRGLLALHTELAEQAEQLTLAGQRQRELLETEQAARAVAEAARARLAFLSHVGAVLGRVARSSAGGVPAVDPAGPPLRGHGRGLAGQRARRPRTARRARTGPARRARPAGPAAWPRDLDGRARRMGWARRMGRARRLGRAAPEWTAGDRRPRPPDPAVAAAAGHAPCPRAGHRAGGAAHLARHRARGALGDPAEPPVRPRRRDHCQRGGRAARPRPWPTRSVSSRSARSPSACSTRC